MKSINHAINGLASSFLLNVGFTSAAEKLDTIVRSGSVTANQDMVSTEFSSFPCNFTPESGQ